MGDVLRFAALTSVSSHLLVMRGRFEHGRPITDRRTGSEGDLCDSLHATRQSVPKLPARRLAAGACGRWAQQTQNGPPSVASRKYEPPVRCPARGASRLPSPLGITPTSFNATRRPRLGKPRVVAHCRLTRPDATAVFLHPQVYRAPRNWRALIGRDRVAARS